jgi:tetratricopeptide (TPR) repeat protein
MSIRVAAFVFVWTCGLATRAIGSYQEEPVQVEPADLSRRTELIGKEVAIDDRVSFYVPRTGSDPDELQLKRTNVTFLVARKLRPETSRRLISVLVKGVLRRDAGRLVCDVKEITPVPSDMDRLERGLAGLSARDHETRRAWAAWAERRARDFKDEALLKRARTLESEALRIEADSKRLGVDAPREWMEMAWNARRKKVLEPEPSALGHRALAAQLAAATTADDLTSVRKAIEAFFPDAATDRDAGGVNLARWEGAYAKEPAETYRMAPPEARKALDRRLWADATERLLDLQVSDNVSSAVKAAEQAATLLPERPTLASRLVDKAVRRARQDLGRLRRTEVKELAAVLRDRMAQPAEALVVLRDWLKIQRDRLSDTDADGPLALASLYEELLQDRVTAIELLRKAWSIDPKSKEIAEAFRTRGFRKVKNEWIEAAPKSAVNTALEPGNPPPPSARSQGLRGLTADEVHQRLGAKPDRISFIGTKGQLIEQWIYLDNGQVRFVNLLHTAGDFQPRVVADYTLPRTTVKGGLGPPR